MRRVSILLVLALLFAVCGLASASVVTNNISFSGKLTDAGGHPLSGTFSITFRLYTVPAGGSAIAADTHSVTTTATGQFSTTLGFPAGKYNGQGLWVSIQRAPDAEKTARTALRPVPYALSLRPGAIMVGSSGTLLTLQKSGDGRVLNILGTGTGGYGVYVNATGAAADAIFAQTSGESGMAIETISYGAESYGVSSTTMRNASTGVRAVAHGNYSAGISSSVDGRYSSGVRVFTQGVGSTGMVVNYSGSDGGAISATVNGGKDYGISIQSRGPMSTGIISTMNRDLSSGLSVYTYGNRSPGGGFSTSGSFSDGITVKTYGENSNGVYATTTNDFSPGLNISTRGGSSPGIIAVSRGPSSHALSVKAEAIGSFGLRVESNQSNAIYATSDRSSGVYAKTSRADHKYGVYTPDYIYAKGSQFPAVDVAEYFPADSVASPGTVMVIGPDGSLHPSTEAYDLRVAGIVSTDPAVSLGAKDAGNPGEVPLAVAGRVPCMVDAGFGAIHPGDVLTTSTRAGYAMKAGTVDIAGIQIYRPGTVLGKALGTLESGTGTIEVLVTLQ